MKPSEINQGVFVELKATHKRKSAIQTFVDKEHFMNSSQESRLLLEEYTETVLAMQRELKLASLLEELIMLHRAKNNIKNLKISFVREYIYVRMHCYRPDNETNDLRVIMGTTYQHGDNVEALYANSDFMSKANEKMESQIDEMIELKRNELNQFSGIPTSETYN
ncbi:hypothetical protein SKC37_10265 [Aquirufa sp. HETE-83D]|uniref:Uncharacterized protein n=1 Tax=Aquirufa esocilacus TaxID=3096513 RepID=A0ABW6DK22_9BACT